APQPGRSGLEGEVAGNFDPARYPGEGGSGEGVFFATHRPIAADLQGSYQNGMQEINIPRPVFNQLVQDGVILPDTYHPAGQSWHVPTNRIPDFNAAIRNGTNNTYHPQ